MSAIHHTNQPHHGGGGGNSSRAPPPPPKVTAVLSSDPVSENRAWDVLTEFLATEQDRLTPLDLLSHSSWHDLHGMAESLSHTDAQRERLRELLLRGLHHGGVVSPTSAAAQHHVVFDRDENDDDDDADDDDEGDPNRITTGQGSEGVVPQADTTDRTTREAKQVRKEAKEAKKAKKESKKAKKEAKKKRKRGNESP